ncbi:RICIN domain-containing protein [Streptomyces sp. NPDC006458]|uniref:RICIN domain-containing protein n=1 Tax=Streptomyces sp. NPDC006458 TaxID=3154302 RepID=UPI0033A4332D
MARAEGTGNEAGAVDSGSEYAGAEDARLTELLRTGSTTAYPALRELRARHRESVLAYARLSTVSDAVARQLAAHAFASAARETAQGADSGTPVRHRLLLLAAHVAGQWAAEERAVGLDPALRLVLDAAGPDGPVPPLLRAFHSLPPRTQGLIWYGLVEREAEERTALLLGMSRADMVWGVERAIPALAGAALRTRLADSHDPDCQDFRRLIEESVRPDSPRHSLDLATHMTQCPHCTMAYEEQCALRDTPRAALAEGLLPWWGAAYAGAAERGGRDAFGAASTTGAQAGTSVEAGGRAHMPGRRAAHGAGRAAGAGALGAYSASGWDGPGSASAAGSGSASGGTSGAGRGGWGTAPGPAAWAGRAGRGPAAGKGPAGRGSVAEAARAWPASRRFALASAALGVALAPLLLFLLSPGDPPAQNAAAHTRYTPPPAPAVTVTATVSVTPSPSPSPTPSKTRTSPSPKPTPTPSPTSARPRPTTAAPKPPPPPPAHAPNGTYAQVVNDATGRCLDIADGWFDKGNDVIAAPCSGSDTQLWRYDAERQVLQAYADDDFCLDSRGSDDRGAGIWTCDSVYGSNGRNLMFAVDDDGVVRPYVAPYTALTAYGSDDGLWFDWTGEDGGSATQRWHAGRTG